MISINPTLGGNTSSNFSVSPALPTGLSMNSTNGRITGMITSSATNINYTVYYTLNGTNLSTPFNLYVGYVEYSNTTVSSGSSVNIIPTITRVSPTNFSSNNLPAGTAINSTTGAITGNPTTSTNIAITFSIDGNNFTRYCNLTVV